jgi:hypothetical protein
MSPARYQAVAHRAWRCGWAASRLADAQWQITGRERPEVSWRAEEIGRRWWALRDRALHRWWRVSGVQP